MNGLAYFTAPGVELWKTDGTVSGTTLVRDIRPSGDGAPKSLTNVNGTLYFSANDGTNGVELWKSDGTTPGTAQLPDLYAYANANFDPKNLANLGGKLYFSAFLPSGGQELFRLSEDGVVRLVKDLAGNSSVTSSEPSSFANLNGQLLFQSKEATQTVRWITDGTTAGTKTLPGHLFVPASPKAFNAVTVGDLSFFIGVDNVHGYELWKSDGTAAGTELVKDIYPGAKSAFTEPAIIFTNVNGTLYFLAHDPTDSYGLWKSDGTAEGTVQVKDFSGGTSRPFSAVMPSKFLAVGDLLYFVALNGNRSELWRSDGTEAGTFSVADYASSPTDLTNLNGVLYYAAYHPDYGYDLWRSDGTAQGTHIVKDIQIGSRGGVYSYANSTLTELAGEIYFFVAVYGNRQGELWKSDGTEEGTIPVPGNPPDEFLPNDDYDDDPGFTVVGSSLYFVYWAPGGMQLFKINAGDSTPVKVSNFSNSSAFERNKLIAANVNGTLYFSANDGTTGRELWRTAGEGVERVADLRAGSANQSANIANLMNVDGNLYFTANDGAHGEELWVVRHGEAIARGDYNLNDSVDGADFLKWQRAFGSGDQSSDGNGDGTVGDGDLEVWRENFGTPESLAQSSAVSVAMAALVAEEDIGDEGQVAASRVAPEIPPLAPRRHGPSSTFEGGGVMSRREAARDALFAAGDFSWLFGLGGDGEFENLLRRRGRAPLARRG